MARSPLAEGPNGRATGMAAALSHAFCTMPHRLRRATVRPGRDWMKGQVEVDECCVGGPGEHLPGRLNLDKSLVVVAAQEDGPGIRRIRMRQIPHASPSRLVPFVQTSIAPGSHVHTGGWLGCSPLQVKGFLREVTVLKGKQEPPSELLPQLHLVISLLQRWLLGTHQGAISHRRLDYYLDEFAFPFNRRSSSRRQIFFRLAQQVQLVESGPRCVSLVAKT